MNLKNIQQKYINNSTTERYNYGGIPIFCTGGIHENIFNQFKKKNIAKDANILVLGSGPGAFEKRLLDNGYTQITSVEFVAENFIVKGTNFLSLDLNNDFGNLGKFDAIFAIELIEHLENPFHFIRCVKENMKKNGVLYLSTPNTENTFARIKYFLIGRLQWFGLGELEGTGHITPIFNHILRFNLSQSKLKISKHFSNANIWTKLIQHEGIKTKILYALSFIISLFMIHKDNGEINLFEIINE